jgi:ferredoxin
VARVEIDRSRCEGHGLCELTAPDIYRLDDDGELGILVDELTAEHRGTAAAGARACPVAALRVTP